jgi:hypothetical protein
MAEGKYHFAKPYLGVAVHAVDEDTKPEVIYWTSQPIIACSTIEAKRKVFGDAIRRNSEVDPGEVQAYVVPFSPYDD